MAQLPEVKLFERPEDLLTDPYHLQIPYRSPVGVDFALERLVPDPTSRAYSQVLEYYAGLLLNREENVGAELQGRTPPFSWPLFDIRELHDLSEKELYDSSGMPRRFYVDAVVDALKGKCQPDSGQVNLLTATVEDRRLILGASVLELAGGISDTHWLSKAVISKQFRRKGLGLVLEEACTERFFRDYPEKDNLAAGINLPGEHEVNPLLIDEIIRKNDPLKFLYLYQVERGLRAEQTSPHLMRFLQKILQTNFSPINLYMRTSGISQALRAANLEFPAPGTLLCMFGWRYSQVSLEDTFVFGRHEKIPTQRWVAHRRFFPYISRHLLTT